jgi:hypothetical protein
VSVRYSSQADFFKSLACAIHLIDSANFLLASVIVFFALFHHFLKLDQRSFIFFTKSFQELVHLLNHLAQE